MPNPNEQANPLFHALTMMLQQQARPSSTYVDAPYVAQQQQQRQQNAFEQAKQEDYFNKVRALNELRAQGTNPSQMFQKANNFVGDFVTGNNTQQMMENVAMNAVPIGKLLSAIAPLAGTLKLFRGVNEGNSVSKSLGKYFSDSEEFAKRFGNVAEHSVEVKNPIDLTALGTRAKNADLVNSFREYGIEANPEWFRRGTDDTFFHLNNPETQQIIFQEAKKRGYDAIVFNDVHAGGAFNELSGKPQKRLTGTSYIMLK